MARRIAYLLLMLVILLGFWHSGRQGIANAWHFKSVYFLENWSAGQRQTPNAYAEALHAATAAWQGDNANPHYALMLARTMEWGYLMQWDTKPDLVLLRQLYEDAIAERPTWSDAYAGYAYANAYIFNDIAAVFPLLQQAHQHGPYMPVQLLQSVFIISDFWQQMPAEAKRFYFERTYDVAKAHPTTFNPVSQHLKQHPLRASTCLYLSVKSLSESEQNRLNRSFCRK
ncbi:hypothetical protein ACO1PK_13650 [Alishewanella sp. d11]|uniref:hypothetical protein n=1 Tax=Alishewanella sp. d11 TaxID=3414030 RepID=UPI003BF91960